MKCNDSDIKSIPTLVAACCALHNLCETHGDGCEQDWIVTEDDTSVNDTYGGHLASIPAVLGSSSGSAIREALCDHFESNLV